MKVMAPVTPDSLTRWNHTSAMCRSPFYPPEPCVESGCDFSLAFPVLAPGSIAFTETSVDMNVFHCGHPCELLLRETAKLLGLELVGKLRPCTGCSMAKGYRKSVPNNTKLRAAEKLGRVFVDLREHLPCRVRGMSCC